MNASDYSPAVHEAAHHPPSDAEQLYADGEGNCSCHVSPPCHLCCSLNQVETSIFEQGGIKALHAHWNEVEELRVDLLSEGY